MGYQVKAENNPVDRQLDAAVIAMAAATTRIGWRACPGAGATSLKQLQRLTEFDGFITVDAANSDQTIYGAPSTNHAFRAWHDAVRLSLGAEFTLAGETLVAVKQCEQLRARYGCNDQVEYWCCLIMAEIVDQALYRIANGYFPVDQRSFTIEKAQNRLKGCV